MIEYTSCVDTTINGCEKLKPVVAQAQLTQREAGLLDRRPANQPNVSEKLCEIRQLCYGLHTLTSRTNYNHFSALPADVNNN